MNERINQLLKQARTDCSQLGSKPATTVSYDELERFAELLRQDEREANAKLADDFERLEYESVGDPRVPAFKSLIGEAIRARGNRTKTSKDICGND
jgi:hypothetical protein